MFRSVFESWLMEAAELGLPRWKRALLKLALSMDKDLRATALDLAAFLREEAPQPALNAEDAASLRARILASAAARLSDEKFGLVRKERPRRAIRPGFALASAVTALSVALIFLFASQRREARLAGPDDAQGALRSASVPTPGSEPSPTAIPATPEATPSPQPLSPTAQVVSPTAQAASSPTAQASTPSAAAIALTPAAK